MGALDYARDEETAACILGCMRAGTRAGEAASHSAGGRRRAPPVAGRAGTGGDGAARTRSYASDGRRMPLEDALAVLGAPPEWAGPLQASGAHYADIRRLWRALVLSAHPDKQPACISARGHAERAETFMAALAAFDAVEACCSTGATPQ